MSETKSEIRQGKILNTGFSEIFKDIEQTGWNLSGSQDKLTLTLTIPVGISYRV